LSLRSAVSTIWGAAAMSITTLQTLWSRSIWYLSELHEIWSYISMPFQPIDPWAPDLPNLENGPRLLVQPFAHQAPKSSKLLGRRRSITRQWQLPFLLCLCTALLTLPATWWHIGFNALGRTRSACEEADAVQTRG
jgi:hypothetical protein